MYNILFILRTKTIEGHNCTSKMDLLKVNGLNVKFKRPTTEAKGKLPKKKDLGLFIGNFYVKRDINTVVHNRESLRNNCLGV